MCVCVCVCVNTCVCYENCVRIPHLSASTDAILGQSVPSRPGTCHQSWEVPPKLKNDYLPPQGGGDRRRESVAVSSGGRARKRGGRLETTMESLKEAPVHPQDAYTFNTASPKDRETHKLRFREGWVCEVRCKAPTGF